MALPPLMREFSAFITAREDVRLRREAGHPREKWTNDPILKQYRFCNINREHDRVTVGIRELYEDTPVELLWFNLIVARLFNHLPTLQGFGTLQRKGWRDTIRDVTSGMKLQRQRVFNPAYIVSTNGRAKEKVTYLVDDVLSPIAKYLGDPMMHLDTCAAWAEFLLHWQGLGDFMANQIITDYKYTAILPRRDTYDWTKFVLAGPGTKRGLNRLSGRVTTKSMTRADAVHELLGVRHLLRVQKHHLSPYFDDLNNLANSFCEFDKYCRVGSGEGKPKQTYTPFKEDT